jgi:hypothetical protein
MGVKEVRSFSINRCHERNGLWWIELKECHRCIRWQRTESEVDIQLGGHSWNNAAKDKRQWKDIDCLPLDKPYQ